MKQIVEFIQEKLQITKDSKIGAYNPDNLNAENDLLYDSEDEDDVAYDDFMDELDTINKEFNGFVVCKWSPLSKIKDFDKYINDWSDDLEEISKRIMDGRDLGYEVRLVGGHLEFDCINSGSRATYYVYALNDEAAEKIEEWFDTPESLDGNEDKDKLKFLFQKGNILPIEI
jgi:hypothetical protein